MWWQYLVLGLGLIAAGLVMVVHEDDGGEESFDPRPLVGFVVFLVGVLCVVGVVVPGIGHFTVTWIGCYGLYKDGVNVLLQDAFFVIVLLVAVGYAICRPGNWGLPALVAMAAGLTTIVWLTGHLDNFVLPIHQLTHCTRNA